MKLASCVSILRLQVGFRSARILVPFTRADLTPSRWAILPASSNRVVVVFSGRLFVHDDHSLRLLHEIVVPKGATCWQDAFIVPRPAFTQGSLLVCRTDTTVFAFELHAGCRNELFRWSPGSRLSSLVWISQERPSRGKPCCCCLLFFMIVCFR